MLVVLLIAVVALAGCTPKEPPVVDPNGEGNGVEGGSGIAKIGLALLTSIGSSTDLTVDDDGEKTGPTGQVDTVIVAGAFDSEGKVVRAIIDTAQVKVKFDENLQVLSDPAAEYLTKVELKENYGMSRVSDVGEWYEQAEELEKWMVGKTVDEIKAMPIKAGAPGHDTVPDVPELASLVTMVVGDYLEGIAKAYENAFDVPEGVVSIGLGHNIGIGSSKSYSADDEILAMAQADITVAATAFDADGKVVRTIINTVQGKVNYDSEGVVTTDKAAPQQSKVELKENYGMSRVSDVGEWYEQAEELEKWMVGKTVAEIKAMPIKEGSPGHDSVPDVPELASLVTMTVADYLDAVSESYTSAKVIAAE